MKKLKSLALINIIGFTALTLALYLSIALEPFPWDMMLVLANIQIGLPFVVFGMITLKNVKQPKARTVKIAFIICFLFVWLPAIALPLASLIAGITVFMALLLLGVYGVFYVKEPTKKMWLFNWLGLLFLAIDTFGVVALLIANQ